MESGLMPDRMIRDSCKTSPTLAKLSHGAERLFWRLTTSADNKGRFHAEPQAVRAACFPVMLHIIMQTDVDRWLIELAQAGAVQLYDVDDRPYGQFCNWYKHQRLYEYSSKFPEPPVTSGSLPEPPGVSGQSRDRDGVEIEKIKINPPLPPLVAHKPRKVGRTARKHRALSLPDYEPDFMGFWERYPRKIGKGAAAKAWNKVNGEATAIMEALSWQVQSTDHLMREAQYTPHPATWLNQRRWEDEQSHITSHQTTSPDNRTPTAELKPLTAEERKAAMAEIDGRWAKRDAEAAQKRSGGQESAIGSMIEGLGKAKVVEP
jgi:hypothetical protein